LAATKYDDRFIRKYRLLLLGLETHAPAARADEVIQRYPDAYQAHQLYYSADVFPQQVLMARLLTRETFSEIAARVGVEPTTIEMYAALFYDVRDRLECRDWITITIRDNFEPGCIETEKDFLELRGYVLRLLAYFGGPLALDATIQGFAATPPPQSSADVDSWLAEALGQVVTIKAIAAVIGMSPHARHVMPFLKLAMKRRAPVEDVDFEMAEHVRKIAEHYRQANKSQPSGEMPPSK
jgi:hypothetical protein